MARSPSEIAADCEALSVIYSEACGAHARAQARSEIQPESDRLYREAGDSRIAMDNVHRRLMAACEELREAGAGPVAANIFLNADRNATLASGLAIREELSSLRGAA